MSLEVPAESVRAVKERRAGGREFQILEQATEKRCLHELPIF